MIDIIAIERAAYLAWPAEEQAFVGPWILRATQGITRRANSAFTAGGDDASAAQVEGWLAQVEQFYTARRLPSAFQISTATGAKALDDVLAAHGYAISGASEVWAAPPVGSQGSAQCAIRCEDDASPDWAECAFDEPPEQRRVHEQITRRAPRPKVFAMATVEGEVAGCGMAVSVGGYTGLVCMATRSQHRRKGIGLALVNRLVAWSVERGDQRCYLQVMRGNAPAMALYRKAGFAKAYEYHYRMKPLP